MARGLIVDDSKFMRKIIRDTIESGGHEVIEEADNGNDGVRHYMLLRPDFVTMDITMGGKDGINAIHEILKFDEGAKIIVVSALNEKTIRMNDDMISAAAFVNKPFSSGELLAVINRSLK